MGVAESIGEEFESRRVLAEPVNENKKLLQKDLLPRVSNPKAAAWPDAIEQAV